jgi:hypothetical protein
VLRYKYIRHVLVFERAEQADCIGVVRQWRDAVLHAGVAAAVAGEAALEALADTTKLAACCVRDAISAYPSRVSTARHCLQLREVAE